MVTEGKRTFEFGDRAADAGREPAYTGRKFRITSGSIGTVAETGVPR